MILIKKLLFIAISCFGISCFLSPAHADLIEDAQKEGYTAVSWSQETECSQGICSKTSYFLLKTDPSPAPEGNANVCNFKVITLTKDMQSKEVTETLVDSKNDVYYRKGWLGDYWVKYSGEYSSKFKDNTFKLQPKR